MKLEGARAIVTGGAGSLGSVLCQRLAAAGCDVLVAYRESATVAEELAKNLSQTHRVRAFPFRLDVASEDAPQRLTAAAQELLGGVDVLVNNAATNWRVPFPDLDSLTPELWDRIMRTNLRAPFFLTRALAPMLKAGNGGRVVNIASVGALVPSGSSIAYAVSKAGVVHLTRCLAVAMAPAVLVNCVAPGGFPSRMQEQLPREYREAARQQAALKVEASPEDIARQVLTFCESDTITGQLMVVDGGRVFH